ncbi:MAG: PfkB family carbohydrate kinase [Candidatus Woesearchaeota archaeon]
MEDLKEALNKFKEKKILVMGDIILDKFTWGVVERINPEQPAASLVKVCNETYKLGGAANVANNVSSLGARCCLVGVIGKGSYGYKVKELCVEKGIKLKAFYDERPTLVKQRIVAHNQQLSRLDFGENNLEKIKPEIQEEIIKYLKNELVNNNYDYMILSDYDKEFFSREFCQEIIQIANSIKIPVHVDPKPKNIDFFRNCNVMSPNKREAQEITGIKYSNGKDVLMSMSEALSQLSNPQYVVITCGKDGVFGYDIEKKESLLIGTKARDVADVTGAGDTFAAALPLALSSGLNLFDSVKLANYASGVVVEKVGTAVPTIEEIKNKIKEDNNI